MLLEHTYGKILSRDRLPDSTSDHAEQAHRQQKEYNLKQQKEKHLNLAWCGRKCLYPHASLQLLRKGELSGGKA